MELSLAPEAVMPPKRVEQQPSESAVSSKRLKREAIQRASAVVSIDRSAGLVWRGPEYPVLEPGRYQARCIKVQGPEWVRSFRRWSLRLEFVLTTEPVHVSAFLNFGSDPAGPKVGRHSNFTKAWIIAKGERPRKGELMSPEIFMDGQIFEIQVEASSREADGSPKSDAEVYAKVTRILSVIPF